MATFPFSDNPFHMEDRGLVLTPGSRNAFEDIKAGKWTNVEPEFESALSFCWEWLNGKELFSLKTSGSTGIPKEIKAKREQMIASAKATRDHLKLKESPLLLCCLNTEMIAGKMMLVRAMEWGGHLILTHPSSVVTSPIDALDIDFAALVPMQLEASLSNEKSRELLSRIRHILIGGAPTSPTLREKAKSLKGKVYQTFGMTETLSHIAMADLKEEGSLVYHTLPGVEVSIDAGSKLVIKAPVTDNSKIVTQDIVELLDEHRFVWKGRADFVINSGGIKLFPEEIEGKIGPIWQKHFPHLRFFIWKADDPKLGEAVLLVVEELSETKPEIKSFLNELRQCLPAYHIPKKMLTVKKMIMTASSKINKPETLKPYLKP